MMEDNVQNVDTFYKNAQKKHTTHLKKLSANFSKQEDSNTRNYVFSLDKVT